MRKWGNEEMGKRVKRKKEEKGGKGSKRRKRGKRRKRTWAGGEEKKDLSDDKVWYAL
jgi:hypothetical protein